MAGAMISVTIDDAQVISLLERVRNITKDFKKPLMQAEIYAVEQVDKHFQDQMGPDEKWDDLSDATLERRRKGKKKGRSNMILQDTGTLKKSVVGRGVGHIERFGLMSVEFGTNLVYAGVHQFGAVIQRAASSVTVRHALTKSGNLKKQKSNKNLLVFAKRKKFALERVFATKAHQIVIPPRPFLWLDEKDQEHITHEIFGTWAKHTLEDL